VFTPAVIIAIVAGHAQPAADAAAMAQGRELNRMMLAGEAEALEQRLAQSFLEAIGGRPGLAGIRAQLAEQLGAEQQVLREAVYHEGGYTTYYRISRFEKQPDVTARWVIGGDGKVIGASISPSQQPAATTHLDYQTRAPLRVPFERPRGEGQWYVAWGGRTPIENYHVKASDQRFAYDLVVMRGNAVSAGDGSRNEDHYCWDEPIVAPAAGTVVQADGSHLDNERPGSVREGVPAPGNYVVIDHGQGEYSLLGHFKAGSLAVRLGQRVEAGALLGRCGNSGRSSLPHLHYHLQNSPTYADGAGLPVFFNNYRSNGAAVRRGEPVRGERLLPAQ
jgi:hypothetical protein